MTEEQEKAKARYNAALKKLQGGMDARAGAAGAEVEFAMAYQDTVRLGLAPQLRAKYRRGKALKQVR
jgi:hypothetical protein